MKHSCGCYSSTIENIEMIPHVKSEFPLYLLNNYMQSTRVGMKCEFKINLPKVQGDLVCLVRL